MKALPSYIRLVRPLNLLIILFTIYMVRLFFLLGSDSEYPKIPIQVNGVTYALFSLSFVFMAAAGYIINDYYDIEIDKINKPAKVIIGNIVSSRSAITTYWILNILGITSGFISSYWAGIPLLGTLFLFYLVGLWFYSYKLKSVFLIGNILIGVFLALVPLAGACLELYANLPGSAYDAYGIKTLILVLMGGISIFAFLSTLIREIVKDAEDVEGDTMAGCRTLPVVIGIKKTKWVVLSLLILLNILIGYIQYLSIFVSHVPLFLFIYFLLFVQVPILLLFYKIQKATIPKDFHRISTWLKAVMLTGIIYVFWFAHKSYFNL